VFGVGQALAGLHQWIHLGEQLGEQLGVAFSHDLGLDHLVFADRLDNLLEIKPRVDQSGIEHDGPCGTMGVWVSVRSQGMQGALPICKTTSGLAGLMSTGDA